MKKLIAVILFLVVAYAGVGLLFMPSKVEANTSAEIAAPRSKVYQQVATLKTWPEWAVWNQERDPKAKFSFEGPETGVGSTWKWASEGDLGTGTMKVVKAEPGEVVYELSYEGHGGEPAKVSIKLDEADGKTKVTWAMTADFGNAGMLIPRWMIGLGMMQGAMVKDFDNSLAKLKTRVEGGGKPAEASMKKDDK